MALHSGGWCDVGGGSVMRDHVKEMQKDRVAEGAEFQL